MFLVFDIEVPLITMRCYGLGQKVDCIIQSGDIGFQKRKTRPASNIFEFFKEL